MGRGHTSTMPDVAHRVERRAAVLARRWQSCSFPLEVDWKVESLVLPAAGRIWLRRIVTGGAMRRVRRGGRIGFGMVVLVGALIGFGTLSGAATASGTTHGALLV